MCVDGFEGECECLPERRKPGEQAGSVHEDFTSSASSKLQRETSTLIHQTACRTNRHSNHKMEEEDDDFYGGPASAAQDFAPPSNLYDEDREQKMDVSEDQAEEEEDSDDVRDQSTDKETCVLIKLYIGRPIHT